MCKQLRRLFLGSVLLGLSACSEEETVRPPAPRPVSVVTLETTDPGRHLRLTGAAEAWRQEDIGFEVSGRLEYVVEEASEVSAPWIVEEGSRTRPEVIARIDDSRYAANLAAAQAALASSLADREALEAEIDHVLPANLDQARAKQRFAEAEVERYREARANNAVSQSDLEAKEAERDIAVASVAKAEADFKAQRAQLKSLDAKIARQREDVNEAKINLDDCELLAPFPATVSAVHAIPGSVVNAGSPVVTLVIMDPIKVVVSVSAEVDRDLHKQDQVRIFPPTRDGRPRIGTIFNKDTVADSRTRTFQVEILTRNVKVPESLPEDPDLEDLPRVERLWPLVSRTMNYEFELQLALEETPDLSGPLFVERRALRRDGEGGWFVWKVANLNRGELGRARSPVVELRKVPIELGTRTWKVLELYDFREVKKPDEISPVDLLASDVPEDFVDGGKALHVRENWMLRPGDLVPVELTVSGPQPGYYVPMKAVRHQPFERTPYVFFVSWDGETNRASRIDVELGGRVGELVRIEAESLSDGAQVILQGAHYVVDGEAVQIAEEVDLSQ